MATVSLREFAAWGQSVEFEMPPELVAMAVPTRIMQATGKPVTDLGTEKKWTPDKLADLTTYRNDHTMPETAKKFGITEQRIRQLLPSKKPKAQPFTGLGNRIK